LIYSLINWYVQRFSFPHKGLKYFLKFLSITGNVNKTFRKKIHNGLFINVSPREHVQKDLFWYGIYEKRQVLVWQSLVRNDSIVIDIGANIGYYSLVASKIAMKGSVYAFEAASQTFQLLVQNINTNRLTNVYPLHLAVCNENSEMELFISGESNIGMTGLRKVGNKGTSIEKVQTTSLDEWIKTTELLKVDLIKIDIEGAELLALKGMEGILNKFRPVLFIEISSLLGLYGNTSYDLYDFMEKMKYNCYQATAKNTLQNVSAGTEDDLIIFLPEEYSFN